MGRNAFFDSENAVCGSDNSFSLFPFLLSSFLNFFLGAQKDIYGGQSETFLRRLQQELFSPLDTGNDQRQLLAQFPQHTNSGISSGALLVVIQCLPCDICFPPFRKPNKFCL